MITINVSELKRFLNAAKNIKDSRIIPILAYIKIECSGDAATMTKTNLHSFLVMEVDAKFDNDCVFLIDEQTLNACAFYAKDKVVEVKLIGKNVVMSDGYMEWKTPTIENNFPTTEINIEEKISLDAEVLSAMFLAKQHTLSASDKSIRGWKCFVHVMKINKKSFVVGLNGFISYFKSFKENLPEISLDPDTVGIVCKFPEIYYSAGSRYDYFQYLDITYGFIKAETARPNLDVIFERLKSEDSLIANRKDLVNFCEAVVSINGSSIPPEVSIKNDGKDKIIIRHTDLTGVEKAVESIKVDKKTFDVPEILFQPKNLLTVMKDLGVDKVKLSKIDGNLIITSDEEKDYVGSIMELAKI